MKNLSMILILLLLFLAAGCENINNPAVFFTGIGPADSGATMDTTPLLNWDDVAGAVSYRVRHAATGEGLDSATVHEASASEYQYPSVLALDDTVYWQVRAVNADAAESAWSGVYSFSVSWDVAYAGISLPDGGATSDTTPLLSWDDVAGAASYRVRHAATWEGLDSATVHEASASEFLYPAALAVDDTVYWQIRAMNEDGVECAWSDKFSFTIYGIGSIYAGGIVFYLDDDGGGLVCAETDQERTYTWGGYETEVGGTKAAVGAGAANTAAIVAAYGNEEPCSGLTDYAAKLCSELVHIGYDDWFLPSKDELDLMYNNLHLQGRGGFTPVSYWSSSEENSGRAMYYSFRHGYYSYFDKNSSYYVRAVRAF